MAIPWLACRTGRDLKMKIPTWVYIYNHQCHHHLSYNIATLPPTTATAHSRWSFTLKTDTVVRERERVDAIYNYVPSFPQ